MAGGHQWPCSVKRRASRLGLRAPIYKSLAAYGHMGREELSLAFEKTDYAEALRKNAL